MKGKHTVRLFALAAVIFSFSVVAGPVAVGYLSAGYMDEEITGSGVITAIHDHSNGIQWLSGDNGVDLNIELTGFSVNNSVVPADWGFSPGTIWPRITFTDKGILQITQRGNSDPLVDLVGRMKIFDDNDRAFGVSNMSSTEGINAKLFLAGEVGSGEGAFRLHFNDEFDPTLLTTPVPLPSAVLMFLAAVVGITVFHRKTAQEAL